MFETAVVRSRAVDRRFSWLSLSLSVHSAAIAAVLAFFVLRRMKAPVKQEVPSGAAEPQLAAVKMRTVA